MATNSVPSASIAALTSAASLNLVQNPEFAFSGTYIYPGYDDQPSDWTIAGLGTTPGGATVFNSGNPIQFWDNGTVPGQGTSGQVAFIQGTGSLEQWINLTPGAEYSFSVFVNERDWRYTTNNGQADLSPTNEPTEISVSVGGNRIVGPVEITPAATTLGTAPFASLSGTFEATATQEELVITATPANSPYDDVTGLFADPTIVEIAAPCFVAGTPIQTDKGHKAVDQLRPGDLVQVRDGRYAPVKWVGHKRCHASPIRFRAGCVAEGLPMQDVLLSADHAVLVGGVLVNAHRLVNGVSVTREAQRPVLFVHVELDRHDIMIAAGMECESYLDTGNRGQFDAEAGVWPMHQEMPADALQAALAAYRERGYAPLAIDGDAVTKAHELIAGRCHQAA